jgi:prevent-host-death family protein
MLAILAKMVMEVLMSRPAARRRGVGPRISETPVDAPSFTATAAKNGFGHVLNLVAAGRTVVITKHETPTAVIVSYPEFQALAEAGVRRWDTLSAEFDELLAGMQSAKSRAGLVAAFNASPAEVGRAAAKPVSTRARKRR